MQRGAGGSRCLCADDCSVTLINREEQVALRQAAGRHWAQRSVPSPLPTCHRAGARAALGALRSQRAGSGAVRLPRARRGAGGIALHLSPVRAAAQCWSRAGRASSRTALGLCPCSRRRGGAVPVARSCRRVKPGRVSLAVGWHGATRSRRASTPCSQRVSVRRGQRGTPNRTAPPRCVRVGRRW